MTFSIAKLNRLPKEERDSAYLRLVPEAIFETFQIDCQTLTNPFGERVVTGIFPPDENFACIEVKHRARGQRLYLLVSGLPGGLHAKPLS